jgi:Lon protease-like protein
MATTQNPDGTWSYSGPILADPVQQAAVERAEREAILTNQATIEQQADAALVSNATFLAIASPTAAQVAAQVKALTRQTNGLIRLLRRKLDATS